MFFQSPPTRRTFEGEIRRLHWQNAKLSSKFSLSVCGFRLLSHFSFRQIFAFQRKFSLRVRRIEFGVPFQTREGTSRWPNGFSPRRMTARGRRRANSSLPRRAKEIPPLRQSAEC